MAGIEEETTTKILKDVEHILTIVRWLILFGFGAGVWITSLEFRMKEAEKDMREIYFTLERMKESQIETRLLLQDAVADIRFIKEAVKPR